MFQRPFIAFPKTPEKGADAAISPPHRAGEGESAGRRDFSPAPPPILPCSRLRLSGGKPPDRPFDGISGVAPVGILAGVAVIEHFAEMGHVRPETLQILTMKLNQLFLLHSSCCSFHGSTCVSLMAVVFWRLCHSAIEKQAFLCLPDRSAATLVTCLDIDVIYLIFDMQFSRCSPDCFTSHPVSGTS